MLVVSLGWVAWAETRPTPVLRAERPASVLSKPVVRLVAFGHVPENVLERLQAALSPSNRAYWATLHQYGIMRAPVWGGIVARKPFFASIQPIYTSLFALATRPHEPRDLIIVGVLDTKSLAFTGKGTRTAYGYHTAVFAGSDRAVVAIVALRKPTMTFVHEVAEAATDPVPPSGWITGGNEVADLCEDVPFLHLDALDMPALWSNAQQACVWGSTLRLPDGPRPLDPPVWAGGPTCLDFLFLAFAMALGFYQKSAFFTFIAAFGVWVGIAAPLVPLGGIVQLGRLVDGLIPGVVLAVLGFRAVSALVRWVVRRRSPAPKHLLAASKPAACRL